MTASVLKAKFHKNLFKLILAFRFFVNETQAAGLEHVKSTLETFLTEINTVVPIMAVIALIGLGIAYAIGTIDKSLFFRWAIGVIIVGSASSIATMFMVGG